MGFWVSQRAEIFWCDSPPPNMRTWGAIPPFKKGISAMLVRYHMKTKQKACHTPYAILSRKVQGPLAKRTLSRWNLCDAESQAGIASEALQQNELLSFLNLPCRPDNRTLLAYCSVQNDCVWSCAGELGDVYRIFWVSEPGSQHWQPDEQIRLELQAWLRFE